MKIPAFLAVMLLPAVAALAAETPKPNFVIINIDDLGYADIGPYGSTLNRTPNLDRMAKEGRKLTSFYGAPVCSPSRAALMTGCYPKRVLPIPHVLFPVGSTGLSPSEVTVAEALKAQGYATGMVGKWHLGDQPEFLPTRQGFDSWFGLPYSNDMGPAEDGVKSNFGQPLPKKGEGQPPLPLMRGETIVQRVLAKDQETLVARYTDEAVGFIKANKERPFFLYLAHNAVHWPLYPGEKFRGKSQNGLFGDWVEEMDWSVGQVLDTLRSQGLAEKTLVIFMSDNGGTSYSVNKPFRGQKGSTWEGGMREPVIAWWPGKIPAGTASDAICAMFDVLPTFVALSGGTVSTERKIDGANLWPILSGEAGTAAPHESFLFFKGLVLEAVRSGQWKLHLAKGELYDLQANPGESTNVADANPEIVAQLRALADATDRDLGKTGLGPGTRSLGKVEKPQPLLGRDGTPRAGFAPK
ncbi:MAG: sulfatase [Chthoniobacter sp.]|nr:sulfatase [Chthoniobacter sp.]